MGTIADPNCKGHILTLNVSAQLQHGALEPYPPHSQTLSLRESHGPSPWPYSDTLARESPGGS